LLNLVTRSALQSPGTVVVDNKIQAHLRFSKVGRTVKCQIVQSHYNFAHDWQGDLNTLEAFLHDATHFHRYLSLSHIDSNPETRNIQVEIFELESDPNSFNSRECRPVGNNLNTKNVLDIVVGVKTLRRYGIKITNKTDKNLYPHVFYFDNSDFSIGKLIFRQAHDDEQSINL
jgi:hypothetical protein